MTAVSTTEVTVQVTYLTSGDANIIEFYLVEGIPAGFNDNFSGGITFDPKLVSLSTNQGSSQGSTIYARVEGAGTGDSLMLVDASGNDLCSTATMVSYALLECVTKPQEVAA